MRCLAVLRATVDVVRGLAALSTTVDGCDRCGCSLDNSRRFERFGCSGQQQTVVTGLAALSTTVDGCERLGCTQDNSRRL